MWHHIFSQDVVVKYAVQFIVSALNITSVFYTRRGLKEGWLIVGLAQSIFMVYSITTFQFFFLILNVGMITAASLAYYEWHVRDKAAWKAKQPDPNQIMLFRLDRRGAVCYS